MTALEQYVRLEAIGLWRETPRARAPREVVVAFGNSTLVLKDLPSTRSATGRWPASTPLGRDGAATIYCDDRRRRRDPRDLRPRDGGRHRRRPAPDARPASAAAPAGAAACRSVRSSSRRPRRASPGPRRASSTPTRPARAAGPRAELGDRMLIALIERHGPPCADAGRQRGARRASPSASLPSAPPRLRVIALGDVPAAALPGGTVLIDASLAAAPAEVLAGWAALALGRDPAARLLRPPAPSPTCATSSPATSTTPPSPAPPQPPSSRPEAGEVRAHSPASPRPASTPRPFAAALASAGLPRRRPATGRCRGVRHRGPRQGGAAPPLRCSSD